MLALVTFYLLSGVTMATTALHTMGSKHQNFHIICVYVFL